MTMEQINVMVNANTKYNNAVKNGMGVAAAKDSLKNILFNARADLVRMVRDTGETADVEEVRKLQREIDDLNMRLKAANGTIDELNGELAESDKENNELRKQLRELRDA